MQSPIYKNVGLGYYKKAWREVAPVGESIMQSTITVSKVSYPNFYRCFNVIFQDELRYPFDTPEEIILGEQPLFRITSKLPKVTLLEVDFSLQEIDKADKILGSFTSEDELANFLYNDDVDAIIDKSIPDLRPLFPLLNSYFNWY